MAGSTIVTPWASHPALVRRPQLGFGVGELGAVVDAVGLVGVGGDDAHDPVPGLGQHLHDVGEVVLALGVVGLHHAQRRRQQAAPEAEDAGVDLVDLELVGRGVAVLDDAGDAVVLAHPHDAAVAGGVVEPGGEDRAGGVGAAVLAHQRGDRVGPQQRRVAREHQHVDVVVEVVVVGQAGEADGDARRRCRAARAAPRTRAAARRCPR